MPLHPLHLVQIVLILEFITQYKLLSLDDDLTMLCKSVNSEDIKEQLKWAINGIDIVGCELTQNIAKILKEK